MEANSATKQRMTCRIGENPPDLFADELKLDTAEQPRSRRLFGGYYRTPGANIADIDRRQSKIDRLLPPSVYSNVRCELEFLEAYRTSTLELPEWGRKISSIIVWLEG